MPMTMLHLKPFDANNAWLVIPVKSYELAIVALIDDAELSDGEKTIIKFKRGSIVVMTDKQGTHLYDPRDVTYRDKDWTSEKP